MSETTFEKQVSFRTSISSVSDLAPAAAAAAAAAEDEDADAAPAPGSALLGLFPPVEPSLPAGGVGLRPPPPGKGLRRTS